MNNRKWNVKNPCQGNRERVLCVCSAGLLRSPTVANVMASKGFNTRAVGLETDFALIPIDDVLISWADSIVCMNAKQCAQVDAMIPHGELHPAIYNFNIDDDFDFMGPELVDAVEFCVKNLDKFLWN